MSKETKTYIADEVILPDGRIVLVLVNEHDDEAISETVERGGTEAWLKFLRTWFLDNPAYILADRSSCLNTLLIDEELKLLSIRVCRLSPTDGSRRALVERWIAKLLRQEGGGA